VGVKEQAFYQYFAFYAFYGLGCADTQILPSNMDCPENFASGEI
jgi:hypothetical protein